MVYPGGLKFRHIPIHPAYNLVVILVGDFRIIHIPAGKLLGENFVEDVVLIAGDGFVNAALLVSWGRNHRAVPDFGQGGGQGEELAFQIVLVLKAILPAGGIEYPVSDVDQVQQPPELLG